MTIKEARQIIFCSPSFVQLLNPRDPGWKKIRIWDIHPESATLKKGDELWVFDGSRHLPV
jgi:hypothetical protein